MPINTQVFRGSEASLQLAKLDSPAGALGDQIFNTEYNISTVGRVTGVQICVETDLEAFHEIGSRLSVNVYPGTINICGSVERAYINGALLRLLMGDLALSPPTKNELQPQFNLTLDLTDPGQAGGVGTKVIVEGVRFHNWNLIVPEDDFITEKMTFKAVHIHREEKTGS